MAEAQDGFSRPSSSSLLKVQEKASLLVEALPYMQRFAGERIVVKFGGHAMKSPQILLPARKEANNRASVPAS